MDLDTEELFGMRDAASRRGSIGSGSDRGSDSEREEVDDGGINNPEEEALEVPDPEAAKPADAAKVLKPKRVIKYPVPKFDAARVAGPRGIPAIQKIFKTVKFKGKGHEKEDLDILLKNVEHWAHRMYPRYPFKNFVEHIEKLGTKKQVQNMMKRFRLDMFEEFTPEGDIEDNVRRGIDEEENQEPVVDVFDELLGNNFSNSHQTTVPSQMTVVPPAPKPVGLTDEQKERLERNKRLAAEKRLARLREQAREEMDTSITGMSDIGDSRLGIDSDDLTLSRMEVDENRSDHASSLANRPGDDSSMRPTNNSPSDENEGEHRLHSKGKLQDGVQKDEEDVPRHNTTLEGEDDALTSQGKLLDDSDDKLVINEEAPDEAETAVAKDAIETTINTVEEIAVKEGVMTKDDVLNEAQDEVESAVANDAMETTPNTVGEIAVKEGVMTEDDVLNEAQDKAESAVASDAMKNIEGENAAKEGVVTEDDVLNMLDDDF